MPTTRATRAAAALAVERRLLELPADVLGLVLYHLPLAHDIALTGLTCRALCDAAKLALKARPFSSEVVTLYRYTGTVEGVVTAPDGLIITVARDAKVWRDGVCEHTIQANPLSLTAVAMLPGGARFVSCSHDRTARLWTLDGTLERTFAMGSNVVAVCSIAALPDGVHFVVGLLGMRHGDIRLYHVDGTLVHTFKGHTNGVEALAVMPDGQHIISGSYDQHVKVWSVATESLVSTCEGHTGTVFAVAAMPDGQRILSGSTDRTVRVWLFDGTLENSFMLHTGDVNALVALPDNQHALSGSRDNTVKLFNVNDGAVLRTFKHAGPVTSIALLPDGLRFVSGSWDKTARIAYHGLAPHV
jgi:WD40 repeat protein